MLGHTGPACAAGRRATDVIAATAAGQRRRYQGTGHHRTQDRWSLGRPIDAKGLAIFTRQLATLVRAGMPILRSLEVLARQETRPAFKAVIEGIAEMIRSGGNLSDGLAGCPRVFDRLYVNMVRAGEAGGVLDTVLERLALFMEKALKIRGRVRSAMIYPAVIAVVAVTIVSVLMVFVVPRFQEIFSGLLKGQPLPALTRALLDVSFFLRDHHAGVIVAVALGFAVWPVFRRTRRGQRAVDRALIRAPLFGDLFLKAAIARFARTFGTLIGAGVPMLAALTITRETSGNVHVADAIDLVHDRVKAGDGVARPLEATRVFPGMVTSLIEVGEETGALSAMLGRVADIYDEEVDNAVSGLTSIVEPLMIVLMALVVGVIVIALFLPLVTIIQQL